MLAHASNAHVNQYINDLTDDLEGSRRLALELAQRAERAGGNDPEVLAFAAYSLLQCGADLATVDGLIERALVLNPGLSVVRYSSGWIYVFARTGFRAVPPAPLHRGDPALVQGDHSGATGPDAENDRMRWLNLFRDGSFQAILDEGLALVAEDTAGI